LWFVGAIVGKEGKRSIFPVNDGCGAGDHWGGRGAEAEVADVDDEGEEDEVEGSEDWDSRYEG